MKLVPGTFSNLRKSSYAFLALAVGACTASSGPTILAQPAAETVTAETLPAAPQVRSAPIVASSPSEIVVFPFAASNEDVTLNHGPGAWLYRNWSSEPQTVQRAELAHATAQNICIQVAKGLANNGWNAACRPIGTPLLGNNVLIIEGAFTDLSESHRLQHMVIGLGAGVSSIDAQVDLYQFSNGNSAQLFTFTTHAADGAMLSEESTDSESEATPAAGGAASAEETFTSSIAHLAQQSASQIVDQASNYFSKQGWNPTPSSAQAD